MVDSLKTPYLLLAAPVLVDPNFARTVVLVGHHTKDGALGWVVNRIFDERAVDLLPSPLDERVHASTRLRVGGPVLTGSLVVLYRSGLEGVDGVEMAPGLWVSASAEILPKLFAAPESAEPPGLLVLGYAGWGPEQLEHEMEDGSWLVLPWDASFAFTSATDDLWERALARLGVNPASVSSSSSGVS